MGSAVEPSGWGIQLVIKHFLGLSCLAVGAVLVLALTGCATSVGSGTGLAGPSAAAEDTASPSTSATATPAFALSCAEAVTPDVLGGLASGLVAETDPALLGPSVAPPVTPGFSTTALSLRGMGPGQDGPATIAAAQTGYFDCQWANADRSTTVVLEVLPQATAAFATEKAAPPASQPTVPFSHLARGDDTF